MTAVVTPETAPIFAAAIKYAVSRAAGPAKDTVTKAIASLSGYSAQLEETHRRVSMFKSFADPSKPVPVLKHYVKTMFHSNSEIETIFDQDDLLERLNSPRRYVLSATAGFGKSMAMRFLALALYENPQGRIPLFLELRHLSRLTKPNLVAFIHQTYSQGSKVALESLKQGMRAGSFVILLDGFDELSHEVRSEIQDQILALAVDYPDVSIIVSGRPDERFKSWRDFEVLKICPMTMAQVVDLLNKLDYDKGVKSRFIKKVKQGLYQSHQSFLSTPLLAILMLLTYQRNSNIPEKLHLFYAKAFETLYEKHDATKEQHERARKTDLAIDRFESLFATFCLNSYVREMTEFEHAELIRIIREAITFQKLSVTPEDFLFDIEESVCLIMREGGSFFFVHRSFQEYFTAVFLAQCDTDIRDDFLDSVGVRHWDSVLGMLFEMARAQLEPTWIKRNLEDYFDAVGRGKDKIDPLLARFSHAIVHKRGTSTDFVSFKPNKFNQLLLTLRRFYPELNVNPRIEFGALEEYVVENWKAAGGSRKVRKLSGSEEVLEFFEVPLERIPIEVRRKSGFQRLGASEYRVLREIYERIREDQGERGKFIQKLFGGP